MKSDNLFWNFKVWQAFNRKLYEDCLTSENVDNNAQVEFYESMFKIEKGKLIEEALSPISYRSVIKLSKSGERYILPAEFHAKLPMKITETVPYQIKKSDKRVHKFITGFQDLSITPTKTMSFKEFIDNWNPVEHEKPEYWRLLKIIALASKYKGVKCCLCSEPESGKTSNFSIMGFISGDVGRIINPTEARFYSMMYFNRVILPDELPNWKPETVKVAEGTFVFIGDGSVEFNAQSMKMNKAMMKVDVDNLSIPFCFNRPEDMKNGEKFFESIWANPAAIKSRYPQLLFKGKVTSKMPKLSPEEANDVMEANFSKMANIAKNYTYFTQYLNKEMHNYDRTIVKHMSGRHSSNIQGVIDAIDAYSEDAMEFMEICALLNTCMQDYKDMVRRWKEGEEIVVKQSAFKEFE